MIQEIITLPSIVGLVYLLITLYKKNIAQGREDHLKAIPIIAGTLGIFIASLCYIIEPSAIPVDNFITAMLIGVTSGLSATGTNQIFKQLTKTKKG